MSARTLRRSFASPFVVTLAALPAAACVQSAPPKTVMSNPPRPAADPATPGDSDNGAPRSWTVRRDGADKCMASVNVSCAPNTMCNPPPPTPYACLPETGTPGSSVRIVQYPGQTVCVLEGEQEMACPKGASCNPPPPRNVDCPK